MSEKIVHMVCCDTWYATVAETLNHECPTVPSTKPAKASAYTATYKGQTVIRKSHKAYTHASVVRWSDGSEEIASFHTSEVAALKGVLTGQQKRNGAAVITAVPVTKVKVPAGWHNRPEESRNQYYQAMQKLAAKGNAAAQASIDSIDATGWIPAS